LIASLPPRLLVDIMIARTVPWHPRYAVAAVGCEDTVEELFNDLKSFASVIPNVRITDEK
jgi:hypothetical protein